MRTWTAYDDRTKLSTYQLSNVSLRNLQHVSHLYLFIYIYECSLIVVFEGTIWNCTFLCNKNFKFTEIKDTRVK